MDHLQEIARSSYADMLNDDERNHAYYLSIKACVNHMVKSRELNPSGSRFYKCCDIGTGSSLLSLMIAKTFRDLSYDHFHITAFEAFGPMAECAKRVVATNGFAENITVISGRSEDYSEQQPQFDLLVAELLDTELIGEGCLLTYRHAVENLCSPSCIFIPQQANIYIQPLESKYLLDRQTLQDLPITLKNCNKPNQSLDIIVRVSDDVKTCCGLAEIDDMQMSQLRKENFTQLTEPQIVFTFKFGDIHSLKLRDEKRVTYQLEEAPYERPIVMAMWWDIVMFDESLYNTYIDPAHEPYSFSILSCAPNWYRQKSLLERDQYIASIYGRQVWREHWIQGVYYLRSGPQITGNSELTIYAYHDSYSLWFSTQPCESRLPDTCTCGVHRLLTRSDFAFLNNTHLLSRLATALLYRRHIKTFPARSKIVFNRRKTSRNCSNDDINVQDQDHDHRWQINFWNDAGQLLPERLFDYKLQDDVSWSRLIARHANCQPIAPFVGFQIRCQQVCFKNLNRIRTSINSCQGFDLTHLDELINHSASLSDASVESHHLHEYECCSITGDEEQTVIFSSENLTVEERHRITASTLSKRLKIRVPPISTHADLRQGWALVFWADFKLVNGDTLSSGYTSVGKNLIWSPYFRQLVHFLHDHVAIQAPKSAESGGQIVQFDVDLSLDEVNVQRLTADK